MSSPRVPGLGVMRGIWFAFTQAFRPKLTVQYPEEVQEIAPRHRGRLILLLCCRSLLFSSLLLLTERNTAMCLWSQSFVSGASWKRWRQTLQQVRRR